MSRGAAETDATVLPEKTPRIFVFGASLLLLFWLLQLVSLLSSPPARANVVRQTLPPRWRFSPLAIALHHFPQGPYFDEGAALLALAIVAHALVLVWLLLTLQRLGRARSQPVSVWLIGLGAIAFLVAPAALRSLDRSTMEAVAVLCALGGVEAIRRLTRSPRLPISLLSGVFLFGLVCVLLRGDLLLLTMVVSVAVGLEIFAGRSRRMAVEHPKLGVCAAILPILGGVTGAVLALHTTGIVGPSYTYLKQHAPMLPPSGWSAPFHQLFAGFVLISTLALLVFDGLRPTDMAVNLLLLVLLLPARVLMSEVGSHTTLWMLALPLFWNMMRLGELDSRRHAAFEPALRLTLGLLLFGLFALSVAGMLRSSAAIFLWPVRG